MEDVQIKKLVQEIREEQQISPFFADETIEQYIKEAEYDINDHCGTKIDYEKDLKARSLLKNYVLYANHKKLAEWRRICRITK